MKIVVKKLKELKQPEKNVRMHGDRQLKEYVRSIEMFGQIRPMIIDENNVVLCGNGLLQALRQMNRETAECCIYKNLSEKQKKKLMLADNKVYELGVNDQNVFDEILRELDGDIDIPGYDEELLKVLTASAKEADEVINSYGKADSGKIAYMNNVDARQIGNNSIPQDEELQSSQTVTTAANEVTQQNQKFVVCPKCGEKIWL